VVSGPGGDEIYTDKYGRVKVAFHWDRQGEKDAEGNSRVRVTNNAGTFLHELGHNNRLAHGGGTSHGDDGPTETVTFVYGKLGIKYNKQEEPSSNGNGWNTIDPSTWPVGTTPAVNDDMPVPIPPWRHASSAAVDAFVWGPGSIGDDSFGGRFHDPEPIGRTKDSYSHDHNSAFEIKDWSFDVTNKSSVGSATGGAGSGKAKFGEFTITKTSDRASPIFFKHCVAGAHYKEVVIHMRHSGDPSPWAWFSTSSRVPPWED
jgi:type VI protein secretion system component Hcp